MVKRYYGGLIKITPVNSPAIFTPDTVYLSTSGFIANGTSGGTGLIISANATASGTSTGTVTTSGPFAIHTFTSSGTFTANSNGLIEYFLAAGGGGGGGHPGDNYAAGGGGGGVLRWQSGVTAGDFQIGSTFRVFTGDVVTVTVGAGGSGGAIYNRGANGSPTSLSISSIGQYIPTAGGGGGGYTNGGTNLYAGYTGGCAGGGGTPETATGPETFTFGANVFYPRQGNDAQGYNGGGGRFASNIFWTSSGNPMIIKPGYSLATTFGGNLMRISPGGYGKQAVATISNAPSNRGGGGNGAISASGTSNAGFNGGSGIAIIRYLTNTNIIAGNVEILIVAGGAAGSAQSGGGAGGLLYYGSETPKTPNGSSFDLYAGTYTVEIGAGGSTAVNGQGGRGGDSAFYTVHGISGGGSLVAYGGGGRTSSFGTDWDGGSGTGEGFAGWPAQGRGTPGQGNNGGWTATRGGGGGGGAGAAGGNAAYDVGGSGGNGLQYSISGAATYYAGGGGGAAYTGSAGGGGLGGGGAGTSGFTYGNNGTANTGGGSGSGWSGQGTGGSGVVILRYPDTYPAATATTGSPTITVTGGYRIYKFTGSGTITF